MAKSDASSRSRDAPRPPSLPAVSRRRRGATQRAMPPPHQLTYSTANGIMIYDIPEPTGDHTHGGWHIVGAQIAAAVKNANISRSDFPG